MVRMIQGSLKKSQKGGHKMVCRIQMIACLVVVGGLLSGSGALASDWKAVQANKLLNVSGMALASAPGAPVLLLLTLEEQQSSDYLDSII